MNPNEDAVIRAQISAVDTIARAQMAQALALMDVVAALKKLVDAPPAPPPPVPSPPPPAPLRSSLKTWSPRSSVHTLRACRPL